jgi:hypothetical protein
MSCQGGIAGDCAPGPSPLISSSRAALVIAHTTLRANCGLGDLKSPQAFSDKTEVTDDEKKDQRQYRRHTRRLSCGFRVAGRDNRGFITNISARGFFIQARNQPEPGDELVVTIEDKGSDPIVVTGTVARMRKSHPSLSSIVPPGIGILVNTAPESYYQLILEFEQKHEKPTR